MRISDWSSDVCSSDLTVVPIDGPLPEGVLGEVRIHREIYRRRPDVDGICRIMQPALMALSVAGIVPVPRHGIGAYFSRVPLWNDPRLLRDDGAAAALAEASGGDREGTRVKSSH